MIKSTPLLISFLTVITASSRIIAQENEKLNKTELREKVANQANDIDSLKSVIMSQFSEISDKNYQINILKKEVQTKDAELKTLTQKNKAGDVQLNNYRYSIDSLQNLLNELTIQLTSHQNSSAESSVISEGLNLQIPGLIETIQPIGWSKDGKFAFRRSICDGGCGCCSSELVVFDAVNNKYLKTQIESTNPYDGTPSIIFDNHLRHIQSIISTYRIVPSFWGEFTHFGNLNASHLFLSMEGATIDPDDYIKGKRKPEVKRIEYTYSATVLDSVEISDKLILTVNPESYTIARGSASHIPIESGVLKTEDMSIPSPADAIGICGYLTSPWNTQHQVFFLAKLSAGYENETSTDILLFALKH
jgi:uncharacterized coiled-coil protein SlyX